MRLHLLAAFTASSSLVTAACGGLPEGTTDDQGTAAEDVGEAVDALRYCSSSLDCNSNGCGCVNGTCQPDGFGPPPEGDYCSEPPVRACTTWADCRDGCTCSGGSCQPDGFSPPNTTCYLPPPDAYEDDSYPSYASGYMGYPQTGHTFHELGDEDWVLVYFGSAGQAKFEAYNLSAADTYVEVFTYNFATGQPGQLVAANDNMCGQWWSTYCWGSRVTVNVPANSVYFARITNRYDAGHNAYNPYAPTYSFRIYY